MHLEILHFYQTRPLKNAYCLQIVFMGCGLAAGIHISRSTLPVAGILSAWSVLPAAGTISSTKICRQYSYMVTPSQLGGGNCWQLSAPTSLPAAGKIGA